jgi:hypothetical protein
MLFENARSIQTRLISSKKLASVLVTLSLASMPLTSWSQDEEVTVKLSTSGICHDASSRHYERVKNFKPYESLQECLDSGGRAPKK